MRELSATEQRVLDTARAIEPSMSGPWGAVHIQNTGWPSYPGYQSKALGISAALRVLRRRGYVRCVFRNGYLLTEEARR